MISGAVIALSGWYLSHRIFRPKISVSKEIAFEKIKEEREVKVNGKKVRRTVVSTVYRIKISNEGHRTAFDVKVYIRIMFRNNYLTIALPYLPAIDGYSKEKDKPETEKEYAHQRVLPFRLTDANLSKFEGYNDEKLIEKYNDWSICLDDLLEESTMLEIVLIAVDSFSGSSLRVMSRRMKFNELKKSIKEGYFAPGRLLVTQKNSTIGET